MTTPLISIAPMMKCTDRHFRYLMRLISKRVLMYTEMITMDALLHGNKQWLIGYDPIEHPLAIQLGGSNPQKLAECAHISEEYGYQEVNLNVGCPSDRVKAGRFGACLMKDSRLVAECVSEMKSRVKLPVTVKCRIGVDEFDSYEYLQSFVKHLVDAGLDGLIVHARKAWLNGLSPKDNRTIPPLRYDTVYQLKKDFPLLTLSINGGINTMDEVSQHLEKVDGVMIGRAVYNNPYILADIDHLFYNEPRFLKTRVEVLQDYIPYLFSQVSQGISLHKLCKHMLGIFHGMPNGKNWRRLLSNELPFVSNPEFVLREALSES